MTAAALRRVKRGDILECNVGDRQFFAFAERHETRDGDFGIMITPIPGKGSKVSHYFATAKEAITHYARRGAQ